MNMILKVNLEAKDENEAEEICLKMVNELRIYNPVAHMCVIQLVK